jgi:hypothetical protein
VDCLLTLLLLGVHIGVYHIPFSLSGNGYAYSGVVSDYFVVVVVVVVVWFCFAEKAVSTQ